MTLWVNPLVQAELQRIAEQEGLSVSKTGSAFLEQALQQRVEMRYSPLLRPIIKNAIAKEMRFLASRLAWLLVRVAFDTGQTRALVTNVLGRQPGITQELLKEILQQTQNTARTNIMRRSPQLADLIKAVEDWMTEDLAQNGEERPPANGNTQGDLYQK